MILSMTTYFGFVLGCPCEREAPKRGYSSLHIILQGPFLVRKCSTTTHSWACTLLGRVEVMLCLRNYVSARKYLALFRSLETVMLKPEGAFRSEGPCEYMSKIDGRGSKPKVPRMGMVTTPLLSFLEAFWVFTGVPGF